MLICGNSRSFIVSNIFSVPSFILLLVFLLSVGYTFCTSPTTLGRCFFFLPLQSVLFGFPDCSVGKESACKSRRPWFDSWVGKIRWRRKWQPTPVFLGFPCGSAGKESTCNVGDLGLIPGLGRSLEKGKATHFTCSGLENSMDCIMQEVTKSQIRLSGFCFTSLHMYN